MSDEPLTPRADRTERETMDERRQAEELALLYNHADNDSAQFTRWQMMTAIAHGWRIAALRPTPPVEGELRGRIQSLESVIRAYVKATGFDHATACPICNGMEGCSHSFGERYRALSTPVEVGAIDRARVELKRVERLAYGYELMHRAICNMSGTAGADGSWYMHKAQEVQARVSPVWDIRADSNPHKPGDCLTGFRNAVPNLAALSTLPDAVEGESWQPIETAPKDGTRILGFGPLPGLGWGDPHVRETTYECYQEGSPGFAAFQRGEYPLGLGWRWLEPVHSWAQTWKPTHWQPLPAPPAAAIRKDPS